MPIPPKSLISTAALCLCVHAQQQLLLVVAEDFDTSAATLQRYVETEGRYHRTGEPVAVNLGRNGLGWGLGSETLPHDAGEPVKREGDGKAPAGIFSLDTVFGYASHSRANMPYLHASDDLICIDDSDAPGYNTIARLDPEHPPKSFEWMRRKDALYEIGVSVNHNPRGIPGAGSCIFLHLQKGPGMPTAGCTSMHKAALGEIVQWLDAKKEPLLVQVPRSYCKAIEKRFEGVKCEE